MLRTLKKTFTRSHVQNSAYIYKNKCGTLYSFIDNMYRTLQLSARYHVQNSADIQGHMDKTHLQFR
jgi:hypothetical protein